MFIRCKNIMAVNRAHRRKLNDGRCAGGDACADDAGRQLLQEQNEREEQTVSTNNSPENTVGQWIGGWVKETTPRIGLERTDGRGQENGVCASYW